MYTSTPWHTTTQCRASAAADTAEQRDEAVAVVTADAQTQARLPADPEAAARAAVAAAALAQVSLSERRPQKTHNFVHMQWCVHVPTYECGEMAGVFGCWEGRRAKRRVSLFS